MQISVKNWSWNGRRNKIFK